MALICDIDDLYLANYSLHILESQPKCKSVNIESNNKSYQTQGYSFNPPFRLRLKKYSEFFSIISFPTMNNK